MIERVMYTVCKITRVRYLYLCRHVYSVAWPKSFNREHKAFSHVQTTYVILRELRELRNINLPFRPQQQRVQHPQHLDHATHLDML